MLSPSQVKSGRFDSYILTKAVRLESLFSYLHLFTSYCSQNIKQQRVITILEEVYRLPTLLAKTTLIYKRY